MNTTEPSTLARFHTFVGAQLKSESASNMSPEEALALWNEQQDSLRAIRQGLADVKAGRTMSFEEFEREFRRERGVPPRT